MVTHKSTILPNVGKYLWEFLILNLDQTKQTWCTKEMHTVAKIAQFEKIFQSVFFLLDLK